jgi:acetyl esterase/lipase
MKRLAAILCSLLVTCPVFLRADPPACEIKPDIVYGHKMGMALTFDVVQPKANTNGAGILFMVSGGWVSAWVPPDQVVNGGWGKALGFHGLLEKGFTLFLVRHGSSPLFKVPECVADVRRAVRFVRSRAAEFGVDAARLGVFGASAGGHLSLMLGTTGDDGKSEAKDPLEKVSNRVAAVVAIFPPSELKSYLESEKMRTQFPALQFDAAEWKSVSPLEHVTPDDAPALLLHGGKDTLVPDKHSREIVDAYKSEGVATDLVMFPDAGHGFRGEDAGKAAAATVAWFEKHLAKSDAKADPGADAKSGAAP